MLHIATIMDKQQTTKRWARSPLALALFVALALLGVILLYDHRFHVFTGDGLIALLLAACVGMHFFMHRGHGDHSGHSGHRGHDTRDDQ